MLIYIHTSKDFFEALVKLEWIKGQKGSPSFISVKIGPPPWKKHWLPFLLGNNKEA